MKNHLTQFAFLVAVLAIGVLFNQAIPAAIMGLSLIGLSGFQRGVEEDEVGINIDEFTLVVEPEWIEYLPNKVNEARGKAIGALKRTLNLSGEIAGSTGIMAQTFTTACTFANAVTAFGASTGDFLLNRATVSLGRAAWKRLEAEYEAYAGITV